MSGRFCNLPYGQGRPMSEMVKSGPGGTSSACPLSAKLGHWLDYSITSSAHASRVDHGQDAAISPLAAAWKPRAAPGQGAGRFDRVEGPPAPFAQATSTF